MGSKISQDEFLRRFKLKFGKKYDLSKTTYVHAREKVEITCPEHGIFSATPDALLGKNRRQIACPSCSRVKAVSKRSDDKQTFLNKAHAKHGDEYSFPRLKYVNSLTPVVIICRTHGKFEQAPNKFLHSGGCPKCARQKRHASRRLSVEEIKKRVSKTHGESISVDLKNYKNTRQKIEAECKVHGTFETSVANLIAGRGCFECSKLKSGLARRSDTRTWIKKAKLVHGTRYDYSKVNYTTVQEKVEIICKQHGPFYCRAGNHIHSKRGCPKCAKTGPKTNHRTPTRARVSEKEFLQRLKKSRPEINVNEAKLQYKNMATKVVVQCPKHGDFKATPSNLLNGRGCRRCAIEKNSEVRRLPIQQFIKRCQKNYQIRYDYSHTSYQNLHERITVICPMHGA